MKKTKKLAAVLLALILCLSLSVAALAAAPATYTITISNSTAGNTYSAYQIFAGDVASADPQNGEGEGPILSNIEWGSGVNSAGLLEALQADKSGKYDACETAADVAAVIGTTAADAEAFARLADAYLTDAAATSTFNTDHYTISGLTGGYYLVRNTVTADGQAATNYIVQVLGNVTMQPKSSTVTVEKKVMDFNSSTETERNNYYDSADYGMKDADGNNNYMVAFRTTVHLADNYKSYENPYQLIIHDKQSAGLTFYPAKLNVTGTDGNKLTENKDYRVVTEGLEDGCTFHVVFDDLNNVPEVNPGDTITLDYTCELNENAVVGSAGNPNEVRVEFSNDPYSEATGYTPWDKVVVFTYSVVVNKVDDEDQPLAGAEFELQKYNADGEWYTINVVTANETGTVFTFKGLDDGIYRLKETVTPAGYNTIDDIEFTIEATHEWDSADPQLTDLKVTGGKYIDENGDAIADLGEVKFTPVVAAGTLTTDVVNDAGTLLPETGGIGTTIFYVLGGVLIVGAAVILVVRRRVSGESK